jgi:hypothetical protein
VAISDLIELSAQIALDFRVASFNVVGEQMSLPSPEAVKIAPGQTFFVTFQRYISSDTIS